VGADVDEATLVTACDPSSLQQPGTADNGVYSETGSPKIQSLSFNTSPTVSQFLLLLCEKLKQLHYTVIYHDHDDYIRGS
jgi:hypothetical protein